MQPTNGHCEKECRTIERACDDVLDKADTEFTEIRKRHPSPRALLPTRARRAGDAVDETTRRHPTMRPTRRHPACAHASARAPQSTRRSRKRRRSTRCSGTFATARRA
eukprot:5758978-Prymnesium_polylepis.1